MDQNKIAQNIVKRYASAKSTIDLENISHEAFSAITKLDEGYVGTDSYMGVAYFWAYDYRILRDASFAQRRKIHQMFLKEKLNPVGVSPRHEEIIKLVQKSK